MTTPVKTESPPSRWPLYFIGVLLFVAGPVISFLQIQRAVLKKPWYVPALATVGLLFLAVSLTRRRSIPRVIGFALLAVVCGLEWFMILVAARSSAYTGPATVGQPLPAFVTTRADSTPFSDKDLAAEKSLGDKGTILLFFRGRW
jgi:hypothetical protein